MPATAPLSSQRRKKPKNLPPKKSRELTPYEKEVKFEQTISRILLLRFELDIARLFSTHIHRIAENQIPRLIMSALQIAPPGWIALNATSDEVKDFFRGALALDMRQAGERVATKSILWSYTAIRHFAVSHDVPICGHRGLHSHLLLPHHGPMRAHLQSLESDTPPSFTKPPHLAGTVHLYKGHTALEKYCLTRVKNTPKGAMPPEWEDWGPKVKVGYERMVDTLWEVANELNVRGYGLVLREKLTDKWCCLSCLGTYLEVCEPTVQKGVSPATSPRPINCTPLPSSGKPESSSASSPSKISTKGKEREWDGRGAGIAGWGTSMEEDTWAASLDFGGAPADYLDLYLAEGEEEDVLSVGESMELRYIRAEREKTSGNEAFKRGNYSLAVKHYQNAYTIEPEVPHYQLNLAQAFLNLNNWVEAEKACNIALGQQKSSKGFYRRGKARMSQMRNVEARKDFLEVLAYQKSNSDALAQIDAIDAAESQIAKSDKAGKPSAPSASGSSTRLRAALQGDTYLPGVPWSIHERDKTRLKISFLPLTIQIDPYAGPETFAYPSWERYQVVRQS